MASGVPLPQDFDPQRLRRRALQLSLAVTALVLLVLLAPGLGAVRARLEGGEPGWLALAVAFEVLSCVSYVLMFRPVFRARMSRRRSDELALSELGVGALVPSGGAAGLALGAWVLDDLGMPREQIARRSVAFFLIKSSVNFLAVAVVGTLAALGLGAELSPLLTVLPAFISVALMSAVLAEGRARRSTSNLRQALDGGVCEARRLVRTRDRALIAGAVGYWALDNAVLWATFNAFGESPDLVVILLGYLIGQLGGLLPLPGGIGGVDGGLAGTLIVYGAPADLTVAAVLAYRVILFWLPLAAGALAFASLRRGIDRDRHLEPHQPGPGHGHGGSWARTSTGAGTIAANRFTSDRGSRRP